MTKAGFELLRDTRWTLNRRFHNPKMPGLTATGQARFSFVDQGRLDYAEEGTLSNGGAFSKRYVFTWSGQAVVVTHDDPHNRADAFQTLVLMPNAQGAWECRASNLCGADTYVSYWCFALDTWRMHHDVSGPNKAYQIETVFERGR